MFLTTSRAYYSIHESMVASKRFHDFVVPWLRHLDENPIDSAPDLPRWVAPSKDIPPLRACVGSAFMQVESAVVRDGSGDGAGW